MIYEQETVNLHKVLRKQALQLYFLEKKTVVVEIKKSLSALGSILDTPDK